eukprot:4143954-Pleurochrysis_carterae.AAC.1
MRVVRTLRACTARAWAGAPAAVREPACMRARFFLLSTLFCFGAEANFASSVELGRCSSRDSHARTHLCASAGTSSRGCQR